MNEMTDDPTAPYRDPVIELYKRDVDRTLIREMLKLTPEQRVLKLQDFVAFAHELRVAGPRLTLEMLIHLKRSAGRPRDLEAIAELEAISEERQR